ncbi:MAG: hypothetical protein ACM30I_06150 [Gemmatimonas sp.]
MAPKKPTASHRTRSESFIEIVLDLETPRGRDLSKRSAMKIARSRSKPVAKKKN